MKYEITEVSDNHLVIEFENEVDDISFIEYWKNNKVIYSNIFEKGLSIRFIKYIIKISKRVIFLYRLGLLKRR